MNGFGVTRVGATAVALVANAITLMPVFLLGALTTDITEALQLEIHQLGLTTAFLFFVAGCLVIPFSFVVHRIRARLGTVLALALAGIGMLVIAHAQSLEGLLMAVSIGGGAAALAQPAVNASVTELFGPHRLGAGFGVKQATVPLATLLCGFAVAVSAGSYGWRDLFTGVAIVAFGLMLLQVLFGLSRAETRVNAGGIPAHRPEGRRHAASTALAILGAALGAGAATALGVFLIPTGVEWGMSASAAAFLFTLCSAFGIAVRIVLGRFLDLCSVRYPLRWVVFLIVIGVIGFALISLSLEAPFVIGAVLAFGGGWTWQGIFEYTFVRRNLDLAAKVTGITQVGLMFGSGMGPFIFGYVAQGASTSVAWLTVALLGVSAALLLLGSHRLGR